MKRRTFLSVISAAILAPFLPKFSGASTPSVPAPADVNGTFPLSPMADIYITGRPVNGGAGWYLGVLIPAGEKVIVGNLDEVGTPSHVLRNGEMLRARAAGSCGDHALYFANAGSACG